jgi:hypothetical protein
MIHASKLVRSWRFSLPGLLCAFWLGVFAAHAETPAGHESSLPGNYVNGDLGLLLLENGRFHYAFSPEAPEGIFAMRGSSSWQGVWHSPTPGTVCFMPNPPEPILFGLYNPKKSTARMIAVQSFPEIGAAAGHSVFLAWSADPQADIPKTFMRQALPSSFSLPEKAQLLFVAWPRVAKEKEEIEAWRVYRYVLPQEANDYYLVLSNLLTPDEGKGIAPSFQALFQPPASDVPAAQEDMSAPFCGRFNGENLKKTPLLQELHALWGRTLERNAHPRDFERWNMDEGKIMRYPRLPGEVAGIYRPRKARLK